MHFIANSLVEDIIMFSVTEKKKSWKALVFNPLTTLVKVLDFE